MKPELGEWIGVDLDRTLAYYQSGQFPAIGEPIPAMVERVKRWHAAGIEVRIVTARAERFGQTHAVQQWCKKYLGFVPKVTATKDWDMVALWDDRAVQVHPNTGERADGQTDSY